MDLGTCTGNPNVHDTDENGDQAVCGGRRMKLSKCRFCEKHDLVPNCIAQLKVCGNCWLDMRVVEE